MKRFVLSPTPLLGVTVVTRKTLADARGFISRLFCSDELAAAGWTKPISQINHSFTAKRGTVRGMHFQLPPNTETKLVSCIRGSVWDVAVDVRRDSPTFLQWHAVLLSAENGLALSIADGIAHGFQAMSDDTELLYCHSAPYIPSAEAGLHPFDPGIGIEWPLPVAELSARDATLPHASHEFKGVPV